MTERSLFYNCRMFTDGLKKGHPYGEIPPVSYTHLTLPTN